MVVLHSNIYPEIWSGQRLAEGASVCSWLTSTKGAGLVASVGIQDPQLNDIVK